MAIRLCHPAPVIRELHPAGWALLLRRGVTILLAVMAAHSIAAPPTLLPAVDGKWRRFGSPHFELYSRNGDGESRDVLYNLELLRSLFLERFHLKERLHLEVTVYYFKSKRDFQHYTTPAMRGRDDFAGFHCYRPDRAIISLAPADDSDGARETIFHEYVHHLFRVAEVNPPLWFNEGSADVLAGMRLESNRVFIGTPLEDRALYLRQESLIPLEELFSANQESSAYADKAHTGVFYAEAWALMHFLYFGDSGFTKEAVERFMVVAGDPAGPKGEDLRQHFPHVSGAIIQR